MDISMETTTLMGMPGVMWAAAVGPTRPTESISGVFNHLRRTEEWGETWWHSRHSILSAIWRKSMVRTFASVYIVMIMYVCVHV